MKQGLLSWSPCSTFLSPHSLRPIISTKPVLRPVFRHVFATVDSAEEKPLTAREKRQLRQERRERKPANNWREEVEERFIKKTKKVYVSWTEQLNLDTLALLGPQWWIVRVSRVSGEYTAERLAGSLARKYPDVEFQVYIPSVQIKKKLKNGSLSVKPKPVFPGCVFLRCVLNKEIHDFIREYDGVSGFLGSKVGNKKREINKPKPVDAEDLEAIYKRVEEEQKKADQIFEEEQQAEGVAGNMLLEIPGPASTDNAASVSSSRQGKQSKKASVSSLTSKDGKLLKPGFTVQVTSGSFAGFSGIIKKLDKKNRLATVKFTLFGKETLADLSVNDIVAAEESSLAV